MMTLRTAMVALLLMLPGCETLGLQKPKNFFEKALAVQYSITELRKNVTILLGAKVISADDGEHVQEVADGADKGMKIARTLNASNPGAGNAKLESVRVSLTAAKAYLAARKGSP